MDRKVIHSDRAPKAVGPYSQAVVSGGFLFSSGQVGLDPATNKLVAGGVQEQARQALRNLQVVLAEAGLAPEQVVKTTIFLTTMDHFGPVNEVYAEVFGKILPARSTVAVSGLPVGALVEIDVVARV